MAIWSPNGIIKDIALLNDTEVLNFRGIEDYYIVQADTVKILLFTFVLREEIINLYDNVRYLTYHSIRIPHKCLSRQSVITALGSLTNIGYLGHHGFIKSGCCVSSNPNLLISQP